MMGSLTPGEFPSLIEGTTGYRHDFGTLERLWAEVGKLTGTSWKVEGTLDEVGIMGPAYFEKERKDKPDWWEPNIRRLLFQLLDD